MRGHIPPSQAASLALSTPQYVDSGNSFSNLGSSGEDLSVCLGTLVLIHLHNTKKIVFVSLWGGNLRTFKRTRLPCFTVAPKPACWPT